jgi:hypothetical protein
MPKKKRTKKDKIQTDQRRQTSPSLGHTAKAAVTREVEKTPSVGEQTSGTFSLSKEYSGPTKRKTPMQTAQTVAISTSAYSYLRSDLLKTTILTSAIVIAELVIYFFIMK